jgi:hypothetical protein
MYGKFRQSAVGIMVFIVVMGIVYVGGYRTFRLVNDRKFGWTNQETYTELDRIFAVIPRDAYVLDLDGRTMYYRDPYYACCIPFGQSSQFLSRPLPSLIDALERTKTEYVYQGQLERVNTLPEQDRIYIQTHFIPSAIGKTLLVRR